MIVDCYGKNVSNATKTNNVAVALKLPFKTNAPKPGVATGQCIGIINKIKSSKIKTFEECINFLNENKLQLYFWREFKENKLVRESCVENGSCGYQLEFLLHWRANHQEPLYTENDRYMTKACHITTSHLHGEFLHYLNDLLYSSNTFDDILLPRIDSKITKNIPERNLYKNEDEWIYSRLKQRKNNQLNGEIMEREKVYYKFLSVYNWLKINQEHFSTKQYPPNKRIHDENINLWYSTFMLKHTKKIHNYSLFQNTDNLDYPHIPNYYILCFTTNCEDVKHSYDYTELVPVTENVNHGALDNKGKDDGRPHYFLYPTFPLDKSLRNGLVNLFEHYNYIFKYGEFPLQLLTVKNLQNLINVSLFKDGECLVKINLR